MWKITRLWSNVAEQATDWEYSGIALRFDSGTQQLFQEAYYLSSGGSVGDQPDIGGQTDAQKTQHRLPTSRHAEHHPCAHRS